MSCFIRFFCIVEVFMSKTSVITNRGVSIVRSAANRHDESVKKFVTRDARETRAASSLPELERRVAEQASRIAELECENAALRTSKLDDISFSSLSDGRDESDDSLSTLVNALAVEEPQDVKTSALDTSSLADLDLWHLDDEW